MYGFVEKCPVECLGIRPENEISPAFGDAGLIFYYNQPKPTCILSKTVPRFGVWVFFYS